MVYIYELIDPRTNETRYIGKTIQPDKRLALHIEEAKYRKTRISHKTSWMRGLLKFNMVPIFNIIDEIEITEQADYFEKFYIALYKSWGINLTNMTNGGGGGDTFTNRPDKELRREKIREGGVRRYSDPLERVRHSKKCKDAWNNDKKELARQKTKDLWKSYDSITYEKRIKQCIAQISNQEVRMRSLAAMVKSRQIPIYEIDKFGNIINEYKSTTDAARILNLNQSKISDVINNKRKSTGGKFFRKK